MVPHIGGAVVVVPLNPRATLKNRQPTKRLSIPCVSQNIHSHMLYSAFCGPLEPDSFLVVRMRVSFP